MEIASPLLKNQWTKRVARATGLRKPHVVRSGTQHYRMPSVEENGGYVVLRRYSDEEIPKEEWEPLEYLTFAADPHTFFAPLTSATGETVVRPFWDDGKPDLDGIWTSNAAKAPALSRYLKSIPGRYGRVQIIRQPPNAMRETRWGLHCDDNNRLNPESNGWVVRLWTQLTDDPRSTMVLRSRELDRRTEVQIPLPRGTQIVIDSERLFHGVHHAERTTRYGMITSFESTEAMDEWIRAQRS